MSLFNRGNFKLHSGGTSSWEIDCRELKDNDWETLAFMIKERVPAFGMVVGIPRGGVKLACALAQYEEAGNRRLLVVDDVLTTGGSMYHEYLNRHGQEIHGAVVFARGHVPDWVTALFVMQGQYLEYARAAIEAIREPTLDMEAAAIGSEYGQEWQAMIDAALSALSKQKEKSE